MKELLKRIKSFTDIEHELENQFGIIVEDELFASANTNVTITHNLGYEITGYIPVKCNTYAAFKFISSTNDNLVLQSNTASTTASFRIF